MDTRAMGCSWRSALLMVCFLALGACSSDTNNFPSEGSVADPVDIGVAPMTYSGTVGAGGNSYFKSAAENANWLVAISNIDGEPDLYLYGDAAFSSQVCASEILDALPDSCTVQCPGDCDIYIRVSGAADTGASFILSISPEADPAGARR